MKQDRFYQIFMHDRYTLGKKIDGGKSGNVYFIVDEQDVNKKLVVKISKKKRAATRDVMRELFNLFICKKNDLSDIIVLHTDFMISNAWDLPKCDLSSFEIFEKKLLRIYPKFYVQMRIAIVFPYAGTTVEDILIEKAIALADVLRALDDLMTILLSRSMAHLDIYGRNIIYLNGRYKFIDCESIEFYPDKIMIKESVRQYVKMIKKLLSLGS